MKTLSKKKPSTPVQLSVADVEWGNAEKLFAADTERLLPASVGQQPQYPYAKDILKLLAAGFVIGLSVAIPLAPMALAPLFLDRKRYKGYRLTQTMHRLKQQQLVAVIHEKGAIVVKITEAGKMRALRYKLEELSVATPKIWDGKWRIVIFDIPEKNKRIRDIFRKRLQIMEFSQLQESVWVHPYPCADQIEFLRRIYAVRISVRYIVADTISDADDLLLRYNLIAQTHATAANCATGK